MRANFNYNGFTPNNSFLAQNVHSYDKTKKLWTHITELSVCPSGLTCDYVNWYARVMTHQKPGENILYMNKGGNARLVPGYLQVPETFWYNNDSVYDFMEGYCFVDPQRDCWTPGLVGYFHNFYHLPNEINSWMEFPYRGGFWSKRYVKSGDITPWIGPTQVSTYRDMHLVDSQPFPVYSRNRIEYIPNWNGSKDSWNGLPDTGNLPRPVDVIKLIGEWTDKPSGNPKGGETYYYAKSGNNSFGLVRYEKWDSKADYCSSTNCCTTPQCDNNNPMVLTMENTYNILSHYDPGESQSQYFQPAFYSDPKLEAYPGTPTNGALPRGAFQLPGDGQTTDGKQLKAGDWVQLTEILTDADWMLSPYIPPNQCPDGYQFLGSFAPPNFKDYKTKDHQGTNWAVLCGTNKNVLLATSCPANYESRGWFYGPDLPTSSYDYQGKDVSHQKVNYCVHYNEFHYPKLSSSLATPTTQIVEPTPISLSGDINNDGKVDINDFNTLIANFGNPYTIYDYAKLAGAFPKSNPAPTPCGQKAGCRSTD